MEEKVRNLIATYGHDDQRTDAWHAKRGTMLTASEIWKALPGASAAARHELIMSKLVPQRSFDGGGSRALLWGTRFEPIAKSIYCDMKGGISIADTTCIPHPTVPFLGASPDGIIIAPDASDPIHGTLVEFKCPISREFSEDTPVPTAYYHQMQLQMECTQLPACEYIEMGFKDLPYDAWLVSPSRYKSFFAVSTGGNVLYKPWSDARSSETWQDEEIVEEDGGWWSMTNWHLNTWRTKRVEHDPTWLATNLESITSVWNEVLRHRAAGTLPEHPRETTTLTL